MWLIAILYDSQKFTAIRSFWNLSFLKKMKIKLLCTRKLLAFGEVSGKLVSKITYKISVTKN